LLLCNFISKKRDVFNLNSHLSSGVNRTPSQPITRSRAEPATRHRKVNTRNSIICMIMLAFVGQ
jgi:hypothetical protein